MSKVRKKDSHIWARDELDWYVEPFECSLALLEFLKLSGHIWDPAAGSCRITRSARELGHKTTSTDLVGRSDSLDEQLDFLCERNPRGDHIVTNPPFAQAEDFVLHALDIMPPGSNIAVLLPLVWASGFSSKRSWLPNSPLKFLMPISPRPSMPPGAVVMSGEKPGNGTKDFAWFVWEVGYGLDSRLHFLNTNPVKARGRALEREQLEWQPRAAE